MRYADAARPDLEKRGLNGRALVALAHRGINRQSGSCYSFPGGASFDAVHSRNAPSREPGCDLASNLPAHATEIAADPEACAEHAPWPWWSFLAVS